MVFQHGHRLLFLLAAVPLTLALPTPALTQEEPMDRGVDAVDIATTPMSDLNLRKDEIPQLLIDAQARPYDLTGLKRCTRLITEVGRFNAVLGDDLDLPHEVKGGPRPAHIAQTFVGSFVPFRGFVRELSGANEHKRKVGAAIEAGIARRSFLKGVGQARGCRYPARAATQAEIASDKAMRQAKEAKAEETAGEKAGEKAEKQEGQ